MIVICNNMDQPQKLRYFFFGQHLADGVRVTVSIILPALIGALTGNFEHGINMAVGALCLSISDAPGPMKYKRNGMFYCLLFVVLMSLSTGLLNHYTTGMLLLIVASTFFFSMFNIYGNRAASVGTGALMIMILRMSEYQPPESIVTNTLFIFAGGSWYLLVAMAFETIRPYRPLQRALGDCITETAEYLLIKADMYDLQKDPDETYEQLIVQQGVVNDKQTDTRELLFKNRSVLKESTFEGRLLVVTFAATVDLFEQIMATWYDYDELREKYKDRKVLSNIGQLIGRLASEIKNIGEAVHSQVAFTPGIDMIGELNLLKEHAEQEINGQLDFTLRKIIVNLRNLEQQKNIIARYFSVHKADIKSDFHKDDFLKFAPHQKIDASLFVSSMQMDSSAFRHSLRVMITCTLGFLLSKTFLTGEHSYWILMTIIIIMKPAYSLTQSRNADRLTGTAAGGIIGLLLLNFVHNEYMLFGLLTFFALGTYTFIRLNYVVMVIFLTPYVLILFHFMGKNIVNVAGERLIDTAIAGVLAWLAMNYLFPRWESRVIQNPLIEVLKANIRYLDTLRKIIIEEKVSRVSYRLVRKDVFLGTANLSAALHRMQSEPKSKQEHKEDYYELVVLNHVLSSNIASMAEGMLGEPRSVSAASMNQLNNCISYLEETVRLFEPGFKYTPAQALSPQAALSTTEDDTKEQFRFIERIAGDIRKIGRRIAPAQPPEPGMITLQPE